MKRIILIILLVVWIGLAILVLGESEEKENKVNKVVEAKPEVIVEEIPPEPVPQIKPVEQKRQPPSDGTEAILKELILLDGTLNKTKTVSYYKITRVKVYLANGYYHRANCDHTLIWEKTPHVWLEEALEQGYKPCTYCKPPSR